MSNSSSNSANESSTSNENVSRDEDLAKVEIAVLATILYFALFGNLIVLVVLKLRRTKLSRMQWFIVHLCLADLFVAIFNVLPQLIWDITYQFEGNDFLCRFVKYFQVVAMFASSYVLVMTAIDRYLSICFPLTSHTWTLKRVHIMISIAWILSLTLSIPQLIIYGYVDVGGGYDCWGEFKPIWTIKLYVAWTVTAIYFIPFFILAYAYGRICLVVWSSINAKEGSQKDKGRNGTSRYCRIIFNRNVSKQNRSDANNSDIRAARTPRAHVKTLSKSKLKTVKLTLAVVMCYLICWAPFFIAQMWSAFDPKAPFEGSTIVIFMLLANLNSCTNPWIYLLFSGKVCRQSRKPQMSRTWTNTMNTYVDADSRTRTYTLDGTPITTCKFQHDKNRTDDSETATTGL